MSIPLQELRELEYMIHQRFNRIEEGLVLIMEEVMDPDRVYRRERWNNWKEKKPRQWEG